MIIKYHVVCEADVKALMVKVEEYIGKGWKPQGGICATDRGSTLATGTIGSPNNIGSQSITIHKDQTNLIYLQAIIFEVSD